MEDSFARVKSIIYRLRDILKCQKCLKLKGEDSMLFYHACDHFFCVECTGDLKMCQLCNHEFDEPIKVSSDKNILSLYQSLVNFELPSRDDVKKIYEGHKKCKTAEKEEGVEETPKNQARGMKTGLRSRSGENNKNITPPTKEEIKDVTPKPVNGVENDKNTPVRGKTRQNVSTATRGKNVTPVVSSVRESSTPVASSGKKNTSSTPKVNINKRNPKGETLLHLACKKSRFSEMEELIAAGANLNAQDNAGWTPLHDAVFSGNTEVMKFLLDNGAKVNAPGLENTTALHEAIAKGNVKIVQLLLLYGADVNAMNIFKETPLDLVMKYNLEDFKEILKSANTTTKDSSTEIVDTNENIIIYKHNLSIEDEKLVNKFADKFKLQMIQSATFKNPPTHMVVSDEKFEITWGIISSVPAGCWIVNTDWVKDSINEAAPKPAGQYELTNPHLSGFAKGRANKANQLPGLFSGCHFFFGGNFNHYTVKNVTMAKEDLKQFVEKHGGSTLKRCPDPESLALEKTIPYHAPSTSSLRETSYFIIYQGGKWDPKPKYNMSHMKTLPVDWLISCIFKFELTDPKDKSQFCDFL